MRQGGRPKVHEYGIRYGLSSLRALEQQTYRRAFPWGMGTGWDSFLTFRIRCGAEVFTFGGARIALLSGDLDGA